MTVSPLHTLHQGPVLAALVRTALAALNPGRSSAILTSPPTTPGPEHHETVAPRPARLVHDYLRHVGGDPAWYRGQLPFHLYPQWGFPILSRTLAGLPSRDLIRVLNGGCGVTINGGLPAREPLQLRARLERVDASSDRRVILYQSLVTGTATHPDALVVEQRIIIPLPPPPGARRDLHAPRKERPRVPQRVREIGRFVVRAGSGLEFAVLTGDFNPLHWLPAYARASGHGRPISHGFSTLARAVELLNRNLWAGQVSQLHGIDVRFSRPLHPPADVGVYLDDDGGLFVGSLPDGPAYLTGRLRSSAAQATPTAAPIVERDR